jgi:DNA polymerase III sliding clamp (beta) subunit (PCNA family)
MIFGEITINSMDLKEAVELCKNSLNAKSYVPAHGYISLSWAIGELKVKAGDHRSETIIKIVGDVSEFVGGVIFLDQKFIKFVENLEEMPIKLLCKKNGATTILEAKAENLSYEFEGAEDADYEEVAVTEIKKISRIDVMHLKEAFKMLQKCISHDVDFNIANKISISVSKGKIMLESTDRMKVARYTFKNESEEYIKKNILIDAVAMKLILSFSKATGANLIDLVQLNDNWLGLITDGKRIAIREFDDKFPNTETLFGEKPKYTEEIFITTSSFLGAIKRLASSMDSDALILNLAEIDNVLVISSEDLKSAEQVSNFLVKEKVNGISNLKLNVKHLIELIESMNEEQFILYVEENKSFCILEGKRDKDQDFEKLMITTKRL